jgi:hypothetical protein
MNMKYTSDEVIKAIDDVWNGFFKCRSHFPLITKEHIGGNTIPITPYYMRGGHSVEIRFGCIIDQAMFNEMLATGHWINQNFIVRLCATLESFQIISTDKKIKTNHDLDGASHVDIVRRLRHRIAHSSGRFDPESKKDCKTLEVMNEILGRDYKAEGRTEWPLAIDFVLTPLRDGCSRYVRNLYQTV